MNRQQIYDKWKQMRSSPPADPDFADNVMQKITDFEAKKRTPLINFDDLMEKFTALRFAKPTIVVSGVIIGLIRGLIILYTLFMQTACVS
ncbi:MAG: hypothetical protein KAS23_17390 [Anaerohalosphaera sp.]|nr:hypothetical protein [Anaerohalosphaera sp.]